MRGSYPEYSVRDFLIIETIYNDVPEKLSRGKYFCSALPSMVSLRARSCGWDDSGPGRSHLLFRRPTPTADLPPIG